MYQSRPGKLDIITLLDVPEQTRKVYCFEPGLVNSHTADFCINKIFLFRYKPIFKITSAKSMVCFSKKYDLTSSVVDLDLDPDRSAFIWARGSGFKLKGKIRV